MNKIEIRIEDALPSQRSRGCRYCGTKNEIKKVVKIGDNISVHFCGKEQCEKMAVSEVEDIFKSINTVLEKSEKSYAKRIWFVITKQIKEKISV